MNAQRPLPIRASPVFETIARGAQFRDRVALRVQASPGAVFQALEEVALPDMKLAWWLGELRYLPARVAGHPPESDARRPFLEVLQHAGTLILHRDTCELITGSAGQLHRISNQAPVLFENRAAFDAFAQPDHEKLFMSIRVSPTGLPGEYWLVLEHATLALSTETRRRFNRYWRVIKPMGALVSRMLLRAVRRKAGKQMELTCQLP